jgi:hypothetical protein
MIKAERGKTDKFKAENFDFDKWLMLAQELYSILSISKKYTI